MNIHTHTSIKKRRIIDAAAILFQNQGYKATTVRDLADQVALVPSSLYSHFGSKEEILTHICLYSAELFTLGMQNIKQMKLTSLDKIKKLIQLHIDIAYSERASITLFNNEWKHLTGDAKDKFLLLRNQYENDFKTILLEAKTEKSIHFSSLNNAFSILIFSLNWTYKAMEKLNKDDISHEISEFVFKGLQIS